MSKNTVTGLRAAAAALGVTRRRLSKFMDAGLPHRRKSERVLFDVSACRDWIALNDWKEADSPKLAPVLHESDPRHRERTANATLRTIENELAAGRLLRFEDFKRRVTDEWAVQTSALNTLYGRVAGDVIGATAADARRVVDDVVAQITKDCLTADLPEAWGDPPADEELGFDHSLAADDGDRPTMKILAPPDPRYHVAIARALARERQLEQRYGEVIEHADAVKLCELHNGVVRRECAAIGERVAAKLAEGPNDPVAIRRAIDSAVDETFDRIQGASDWVRQEYGKHLDATSSEDATAPATVPTSDTATVSFGKVDDDRDEPESITLLVSVAASSAPFLSARVV
jgi:hypothetical protein